MQKSNTTYYLIIVSLCLFAGVAYAAGKARGQSQTIIYDNHRLIPKEADWPRHFIHDPNCPHNIGRKNK